MRLPGRLSAAMEVLADIEARKRPATDALRDWGLGHRFAGAGDRGVIGNLVHDALRRRASHAFAMGADTPRALVLAVAVFDWGENADALTADFAADRFAPEPLADDELSRLKAVDPLASAPDHVRADVPDWLAPSFAATFGDAWVTEGRALATRPPLDLRINTLKSSRERVMKTLARFHPVPGPVAPNALRIPAGTREGRVPNVQADEGFVKGWFEIQDAGSQIVSALAGAAPGLQVLDYCAGGGGKTLAMAAAMGNTGQIFAYDAERARLAPIHDRLKRAGARNVQVRNPDPGALDDLEARMDRVVVDAPCTGTGTWRRRPDAKWRLAPGQLETRRAEQAQILESAVSCVKPGGELVYITCSLLPEENWNQIAHFLAQHAEFTPVSLPDRWLETFGAEARTPLAVEGGGIMLTPATMDTDGFFCSVLRKTS